MKQYYTIISLFILFLSCHFSLAQELYVGSGAEFHLKKGMDFTTSNTTVTLDASGKFSLEAGSLWGDLQEYVNGKVFAYSTGETKFPIGNNGVYAPVMTIHTGDMDANYFNSSPMPGTNGADVDAVSDIEYWELHGNAIITLPWNNNSDITSLVNNNGGKLNSVAIVGYNGGVWNLASASQTNTVTGDLLNGDVTSDSANEIVLDNFSQFTFGIDHQVVLGIDDLFISNDIRIVSNPIESDATHIQFLSNNLNNLQITLYDLSARKIKVYKDVIVSNSKGSIKKPNLKSGIYFLKFEHEEKQGVKKILIK